MRQEKLYEFLQSFANSQGYVVTMKKLKKNKWVTYKCDRGGKYCNRHNVDEASRKRKRGILEIECPITVSAKLTDVGWKLKVVNKYHNHGATPNLLGYPQVRRRTIEDVQQIVEMSNANIVLGTDAKNALASKLRYAQAKRWRNAE